MEEFKTTPEEFNGMLLDTLDEFHQFQVRFPSEAPPYPYTTLGLAAWLDQQYFKGPSEGGYYE